MRSGCKWKKKSYICKKSLIFVLEFMASFIGDYSGKIDAKGRIVFPSAFVKQLPEKSQDKFVLKQDIYEKCLIIYTMEEWERQVDLIRAKLNLYNKEHSQFLRQFYKGTVEVSLDANNRLLIPSRLLEYAEIDKDMYFSGQDRKIEIWSKEKYESKEDEVFDFANLAQKVMGGDLPQ